MPMNEFGEIVRSNNQTSSTSNISSSSSGNTTDWSFSSEVQSQFPAAKKRNFNLITLAIAVPLYSVIGYFATRYFLYQGYDIGITCPVGALIGAIAALIATLVYNNKWAKNYEGAEYLVSLLFTGIAAVVIALAIAVICFVVGVVIAVVQAIIGIVIVIAILAGLAGG